MKQPRAQRNPVRRTPNTGLARGPHQPAMRRTARRTTASDVVDYGNTTRNHDSGRERATTGPQRRPGRPRGTGRAVNALAIVFAVHGMISGNFATRVPSIAGRLDLDSGELGLALLCSALGAAVIIPIAGRLVARWGGRNTTRGSVVIYCGMLALPAFTGNLASLCAILLGYGVLCGICDVAMKAQGNALEHQLGRPIMSRLFGMWSLGALAGAGTGTAATILQLDVRLHLAWMALALAVLASASSIALPNTDTAPSRPAAPRARRQLSRPSKALLGVAVIAFCAAFGEAAAHSWSAVYITQVTHGTPAAGSFGFAAFVASMAAGRLAGDHLVSRVGPVRAVRAAGLLAIAGGCLVAVAKIPAVGLVGFALLGLGIAVIVPVALSAGARVADTPAQGLSMVLVFAQLACTVTPVTIGSIADRLSLPAAFVLTVAVVIPVVLLARTLRGRATAPAVVAAIDAVPARTGPVLGADAAGAVAMARVPIMAGDDPTIELPAVDRAEPDLAGAPVLAPA